jgi:hypothetical protein
MKTTLLAILILSLYAQLAAARDRELLPGEVEALKILKAGTKFTLFSVFPHGFYASYPYPELKPEESFHGYKILGSTDLAQAKQRQLAVASVEEAIRSFAGTIAGCFEPQHGLRIQTPDAVFDFVICFHCHYIKIYRGEQYLGMIPIAGSGESMDSLLTAAKVPLPRREDSK